MKKLPLQWKVFVYLMGFCVILLVILWLFQSVFLEQMYQAVRKRELSQAVDLVEQNLENPDLSRVLQELDEQQEILVMPSTMFEGWQRKNQPSAIVMKDGQMRATITEMHQFDLADGSTLSLTFYATISPVSATVSTLQYQLLWISGVLILLSVILAYVIARHVATPLANINQSAKQLAKGAYDTHFSGTGFLEVAELSDTLNATARELSQVENLRKELLANISHDLRTPLALIYGYAEWMHDFPEEIGDQHTRLIMDETKRLSSLVDDVLQLSQLEASGIKLHLAPYSLRQSVNDTLLRVGELVREEGYHLTLHCDPDDDELMISADEGKITQAFYNLLLNAINHSGEDREVIVRLSKSEDDQRITLAVADHGVGIAPKDLDRIWERYYKVDQTHKRSVTGSGLGLSIVKKIVTAHGGTYQAQSDGIGRGSCFSFSLPATLDGKAQPSAEAANSIPRTP